MINVHTSTQTARKRKQIEDNFTGDIIGYKVDQILGYDCWHHFSRKASRSNSITILNSDIQMQESVKYLGDRGEIESNAIHVQSHQ